MAYFKQNNYIIFNKNNNDIDLNNILVPFDTSTDEQLTNMVNAYYNGEITLNDVKSVWSVGDKRKISLSVIEATSIEESHVAQEQYFTILDFDHDNLTNSINDKEKALISLQQLNLLSNDTIMEGGYMNPTLTCEGGWANCVRRTWCNKDFKNALPNYIQNLIKQVTKEYCPVHYNLTKTIIEDYIWLPSENEIFGVRTSSPVQEGTQYSYYAIIDNRIKYTGNANTAQGTAYYWWDRSLVYSNSNSTDPSVSSAAGYFNLISETGTVTASDANDADNGIAPAFCI
jgi:hypothetical protein